VETLSQFINYNLRRLKMVKVRDIDGFGATSPNGKIHALDYYANTLCGVKSKHHQVCGDQWVGGKATSSNDINCQLCLRKIKEAKDTDW
jgi:hypothetical protein